MDQYIGAILFQITIHFSTQDMLKRMACNIKVRDGQLWGNFPVIATI